MSGMNQIRMALAGERKEQTKRRSILAFMACIVILFTAVILMLPAISASKSDLENAGVAGLSNAVTSEETADEDATDGDDTSDPQEEASPSDPADSADSDATSSSDSASSTSDDNQASETSDDATSADQPESTPAGDGEEAVADPDATDENAGEQAAEEDAETPMPAQNFYENLKKKDQDGNEYIDLAVYVEAPEGAFPEGTTMKIKRVKDKDIKDEVEQAVKDAKGDNSTVKRMTAVDIVFLNADGDEIEPAKKVDVKISANDVREIEEPVLVHVVDKDKATQAKKKTDAEVLKKVDVVNWDDEDKSKGNEDTLKFATREFSPYVIVEVETITADVITASGEAYKITVSYDEEAGIPEGATLQATEIAQGSDDYQGYLNESAQKLGLENADGIEFARFFDIQILNKDGEKLEPKTPVEVKIEYADKMDLADGKELAVVHFADAGTEVISDVNVNDDATEVTYKQGSFSVTGTIVTPNTNNGKYMILVHRDDKYYIVNNDGTLSEVSRNADGTVNVDDPMMWTFEDNHLYHPAEAVGFASNQTASAFYYRYVNPAVETGLSDDNSSNTTTYQGDGPQIGQNSDRQLWAQTGVTYSGNRLSIGNQYLGVVDDNGTLRIAGQKRQEEAAEIIFADALGVAHYPDPSNNSVNHIDISIVGTSEFDFPLAYGKYYDQAGNVLMDVSTPTSIPLSSKVDITIDDMKRATITAYQKKEDGTVVPLNDAFYITGYSKNENTQFSTDQVRIEGSFTTSASMNGEDINQADGSGRYTNRLKDRVYYTVTVTKPITFTLKDTEGHELYDSNHELLTVTVNVTMSASFDYWDSRNECPPLQPELTGWYWNNYVWQYGTYHNADYDSWVKGGYASHNLSGMDFVLGGEEDSDANVVALEIGKLVVDSNGNRIHPAEPITNTFDVYQNTSGSVNKNAMADVNVGEYKEEEVGKDLYSGYNNIHSKEITIGNEGVGLVYDYDVTPGMYYISERKDDASLPKEIVDADGEKWTYKETRIETEYVRRGDKYDDKTAYPNPMHVSKTYTSEDDAYNSIPEVLGKFTDLKGEERNSAFVEFFVYNVYEREKTDLTVEKKWENGTAPDGASVDVVLKRYKLVPDGSATPPEPTTASLSFADSFSGLSGDKSYSATYRVTGPNGYDQTFNWDENGTTIDDLPFGEYTITKTAPEFDGYTIENGSASETVTLGPVGASVAFAPTVYTRQTSQDVYYHVLVYAQDTSNQGTEHIASNGHYAWVDTDYPAGSVLSFNMGVPNWNNNAYSYSVNGGSWVSVGKGEAKTQQITLNGDCTIVINGNTPYYSQWLDPTPNITVVNSGKSANKARAKTSQLKATGSNTISNPGTNPELEGYTWQEDTTWNNGEGLTVHLPDGGSWRKLVEDLEQQDAYGNVFVYYIESVTENGMPQLSSSTITLDGGDKLFVYGDHKSDDSTRPNDTLEVVNVIAAETGIYIAKVKEDGTTPLSGATFSVQKYNDAHQQKIGDPITGSVDASGYLPVNGLTVGHYKLEETLSPPGYVRLEDEVWFEVRRDSATQNLVVVFENTNLVTYDQANKTFTVKNTPGKPLPHTGGMGTVAITLLGMLMVAAAGMIFLAGRRPQLAQAAARVRATGRKGGRK